MNKTLTIATRKSKLALWQSLYVKSKLEQLYPKLNIKIIKITTKGDKILNSPLSQIGGKGLFIKELEQAILDKKANIAVHSVKDIPYKMPQGFSLAAILKRENPFDAFVSNNFSSIKNLPKSAKVGTCSTRRILQLKAIRPDLITLDLRGNINTRLEKLDNNQFDAIILACAGLIRLGLNNRITKQISPNQILPAVGQGAIGIEALTSDNHTLELLKPLADINTTCLINAERAMNQGLQGGCSSPIAGFATSDNNKLTLTGLVGNIATSTILKHTITGNITKAKELGTKLSDKLISQGAKDILK
jgi:hydroxymethylbilane synthase